MLSRRIGVVFSLFLGLFAYFYLAEDAEWAFIPGIVFLGLAVIVFILQHQIDWWWYQKNPPDLPIEIDALYSRTQSQYRAMSEDQRQEFGRKAFMFVQHKEFIMMGPKEVPEDIKYMVAYCALLFTRHQEDYVLKSIERVVCYLHPFLTPNYSDTVHVYECEPNDGTLIFSIEHLLAGFMSDKHYQLGIHALAEAYHTLVLQKNKGDVELPTWEELEMIGGISKLSLEQHLGIPQDDAFAVACHHFFRYPEKFQEVSPHSYQTLNKRFG